jgi:hypothetical protein
MAYLTKFKSAYPASEVAKASCKMCHVGSGFALVNDFAKDFTNNNHDYKAIEGFDSDVDGFTNIAEINAGTLPGDQNSHPAL